MVDYMNTPLGNMGGGVHRARIGSDRKVVIVGEDFGPVIEVGRSADGGWAIWKKIGRTEYIDRGAGNEYMPTEYWLVEITGDALPVGVYFTIVTALFAKEGRAAADVWRAEYRIIDHLAGTTPRRKPGRPPSGVAPKEQTNIMLDSNVKAWALARAGDGSLSSVINEILAKAMRNE